MKGFLNNFPVRLCTTRGEEEEDDYDDDMNRKTKRPTIDIEVDDDEDEDDSRQKKKRSKFSHLGLNLRDDYIEIEEIKARPLPREDGYQWSKWQNRPDETERRPYGKVYLEDQAERQKILSRNKDYRFANELAGALRKELSDIVDPENMERLRQAQALERAETDIELKRTRVSSEKKFELIKKLKDLRKEEQINQQTRRNERPSPALRSFTMFLIDIDQSRSPNTMYPTDFLDFVSLYDSYGTGTLEGYIYARDAYFKEAGLAVPDDKSEEWLNLFYAFILFHRDFLSNLTTYTLAEAIKTKVAYVRDHLNDLDDEEVIKVKKEAVKEMDPVESSDAELGIEWAPYKQRNTETINMVMFKKLKIPLEIEGRMAKIGASIRYMDKEENAYYANYANRVIQHIYGSCQEEKDNATKNTTRLGQDPKPEEVGLDLLSENPTKGGHPESVAGLIRMNKIALNNGNLKQIEEVVKSHFLWLFFEEMEESVESFEVISKLLLVDNGGDTLSKIRVITTPYLSDVLVSTMLLYKTLVMKYLARIAKLLTQKEESVILLTPTQTALLKEAVESEDNVARFDKLNASFKGVNPNDILEVSLFSDYLRTGVRAFDSQQININDLLQREGAASWSPPNMVEPHPEYPVLMLHRIYRLYEEFRREHITSATNNIARIDKAIEDATRKLTEMVGGEKYSLSHNTEYRQRKEFTSRPENSGFIKLRAEIDHLLKKAFHFVNDYCHSLRDLPLEAYQSDSAYTTGLSTDFISFVAVLSADLELMFPDGYRSARFHTKIKEAKHSAMLRLKRYSWTGGRCGAPYVIRKDVDTTPFFASPLYQSGSGSAGGGTSRNVIMF